MRISRDGCHYRSLPERRRMRRNHRLRFVPLVLTLLLMSGSPCPAQQQVSLSKIEFVGLKRLSAAQATEMSGLKPG